ncbi:PD-(D/E)XK motif protein, partial [Microcoleus sp. MON1_C1]|uniref:PD-(D/E)XK motif protein n=1 Tax=Microcoleus sp. MON1_C1 TaxID=2818827 RepID=UPI002FD089DA
PFHLLSNFPILPEKSIFTSQMELLYFKVERDFPRIIEADLRNGVGDVRYTISVAECRRFSIPELDVISLISRSHE